MAGLDSVFRRSEGLSHSWNADDQTNVSAKDDGARPISIKAMGRHGAMGDTIRGDYIEDTIKQIDGLVDTVVTLPTVLPSATLNRSGACLSSRRVKPSPEMNKRQPHFDEQSAGKNYKHDYRLGKECLTRFDGCL